MENKTYLTGIQIEFEAIDSVQEDYLTHKILTYLSSVNIKVTSLLYQKYSEVQLDLFEGQDFD
jgi:transposase